MALSLQVLGWAMVFAAIAAAGYFLILKLKRQSVTGSEETELAVLQFGKAFPGEAIRDVIFTADGNCGFLRLYGDNVGIIRHERRISICKVLEPGSVFVQAGANRKTLQVQFGAAALTDGDFVFHSEKDAAEVSLWLLGSLLSAEKLKSADAGDVHPPV